MSTKKDISIETGNEQLTKAEETSDGVPVSPPVMVYVVAPAALPAGYKFEAQVQGFIDKTFPVVVPEGGVVEGQEFLVPLPDDFVGQRIFVPTGRWKDGLFDLFRYGPLHPSLCCGIFCTQLGMAQVMTRMHLTFLGEPGTHASTRNTFKIVAMLYAAYTIYGVALEIASPTPDDDDDPPVNPVVALMKAGGTVAFTIYSIYALMKTREFVRIKYSISEGRFGAFEDLLYSIFCSCCTVAQMARHTGEYETYKGTCLSQNGLPEDAPLNV